MIAGPKHFAGYGAALGGRDYDESNISDAELWNTYFPPFKAAIDAGAGNIMSAYMDLNGVPAAGNQWLLNDVLRDGLGFDGFVVSDAQAVHDLATHHFAADLSDAAARALNAGNDMEMTFVDPAFDHLVAAVEDGRVTTETLDTAVRRVLEAKVRLGLFENPYVDEAEAQQVLADPAHREVAKIAAQRSAVLLRNVGDLLPLSTDRLDSVAVIGPLADSPRDTLGPWIFNHDLSETVTLLDGIRARVGEQAEVRFAPGVRPSFRTFASMFDMWPGNTPEDPEDFDDDAELAKAAELAARSDVAVLVAGEWQNMIGESASRSSLELPGRQLELIQAVVATGTPTVLLVMNGRPLDLRWPAENVPAILDVWYPGSQGGHAVAALLFGDDSPAGKLPFTWPRTVGQVLMIYNHSRSHLLPPGSRAEGLSPGGDRRGLLGHRRVHPRPGRAPLLERRHPGLGAGCHHVRPRGGRRLDGGARNHLHRGLTQSYWSLDQTIVLAALGARRRGRHPDGGLVGRRGAGRRPGPVLRRSRGATGDLAAT